MHILAKIVAVCLVATLCCADHDDNDIEVRQSSEPRNACMPIACSCLIAQRAQVSPRSGVEERRMRVRSPLMMQYCSSGT